MKNQKDIPYGISDFRSLIQKNKYYVDRTNYIEKLEKSESFLFFLRPRRFGKSLIISMLIYYYGVQYKDEFESLFGELYVGKNPTKSRNSYYVMKFDFSGIDTSAINNVMFSFCKSIKGGLEYFNDQYHLLDEKKFQEVLQNEVPSDLISDFLTKVVPHLKHKIIILIDEYDHFTNEILSFHFPFFADIVSKNGFVRKFYEKIKTFTGQGIIDRFFATGITPVTLDSMTSGFNIAVNISGKAEFNEMAGFTTAEVKQMIYDLFAGIEESEAEKMLEDAEKWYNGSLFSLDSSTKLYNPAMLLRFMSEIDPKTLKLPREMIDVNILSDYTKIENIVKFKNYDENLEAVKTILQTENYNAMLTLSYNFEKKFTVDDFISLLYYNGLLTIKGSKGRKTIFEIPNQVIKVVYWDFFAFVLSEKYNVKSDTKELEEAVDLMAFNNEVAPLMKIIENILHQLSNRDSIRFDEKYIKMLVIVYVAITKTYEIISEREVNRRYVDLLFLGDQVFIPKYQHLFELKYLKKKDAANLDSVKEEAINQVRDYMQLEDLKIISNLKYWLIIFVGDDCAVCEEVKNNC